MKQKKRWIKGAAVAVIVALGLTLTACDSDDANTKDQDTVNKQQQIYNRVQPVHVYPWSLDRDTLQQIYDLKNEARTTWSVVTAQGSGAPLFVCPSRGYPLPADAQLTNPLQKVGGTNTTDVVEQPEPNGLYSSKNTDATYVLCVRANGDVTPVYAEGKVLTFPFAVKIDANGKITEDESSPSTAKIHLGKK